MISEETIIANIKIKEDNEQLVRERNVIARNLRIYHPYLEYKPSIDIDIYDMIIMNGIYQWMEPLIIDKINSGVINDKIKIYHGGQLRLEEYGIVDMVGMDNNSIFILEFDGKPDYSNRVCLTEFYSRYIHNNVVSIFNKKYPHLRLYLDKINSYCTSYDYTQDEFSIEFVFYIYYLSPDMKSCIMDKRIFMDNIISLFLPQNGDKYVIGVEITGESKAELLKDYVYYLYYPSCKCLDNVPSEKPQFCSGCACRFYEKYNEPLYKDIPTVIDVVGHIKMITDVDISYLSFGEYFYISQDYHPVLGYLPGLIDKKSQVYMNSCITPSVMELLEDELNYYNVDMKDCGQLICEKIIN